MWNNKFNISFYSIVIWTILINAIKPANGSFLKILITLLLWLSIIITFTYFIKNYKRVFINIPRIGVYIYLILLIWNFTSIFRSLFSEYGSLKTMFGNPYTSLSLLIPFVLSFGVSQINLLLFRKTILNLLKIGLICMPLLIINKLQFTAIFKPLLYSSVFFTPTIFNENRWTKILILISSLIMILIITPEQRSILIRYSILTILSIYVYIYYKYKITSFLKLLFITIIIPLFFLFQGYINDISIFQTLSENSDAKLTTDTRTFLYKEVFNDLITTNSLITGKGSNSTYKSEYFSNNEGDSETRLTSEVGFLAIIQRGGIIAVVLNLFLFVYSIYLAFFRSSNYYAIAIGCFVLIHFILLFVENLISYDLYNYIVWFCIGLCLNNKFRRLKCKQIKALINEKRTKNIYCNPFVQPRAIH